MANTPRPAALLVVALVFGCAHEGPPSTASTASAGTAQEAPTTSNENAAQVAGEAWLALVDAGSYAKSWTESAAAFRKAIDQAGWEKALNGVRAPLGKVLSRSLKSAKYATSLPGAPDGEYVVIQYDTSFTNKRSAVETITPMKEPDGSWRVSGYFIR